MLRIPYTLSCEGLRAFWKLFMGKKVIDFLTGFYIFHKSDITTFLKRALTSVPKTTINQTLI